VKPDHPETARRAPGLAPGAPAKTRGKTPSGARAVPDPDAPMPDFEALLRPVREAARTMPREALPALYGAIATLQAELLLPPLPEPVDRDLTPEEVGRVLRRSRDWTYRHRFELPATRLPSGRWIVRESRLRRWLEARDQSIGSPTLAKSHPRWTTTR
jgi:hypothetical protein